MQFENLKKKILEFLGINVAGALVNVLCKTLFIEEENRSAVEELKKENKNFVFVFWHGTMIVPWFLMRDYGFSTIISKSKDGEILTRLLKKWKYNVERGSSSNGGAEVLETLIENAKIGKSIAITPDGPRGPEKKMKAGAVVIAKKTGIPIILAGTAYKQRLKLNSWDRFEIPMFFTKVCIKYSDPIYIDHNLSYDETDQEIKNVELTLVKLQNEMGRFC